MTITEAARRFGIAPRTLQYAVNHGHLDGRRMGPLWVVTAAAVGQWIAHGKHTPGPVPGTKQRKKQPRPDAEGA